MKNYFCDISKRKAFSFSIKIILKVAVINFNFLSPNKEILFMLYVLRSSDCYEITTEVFVLDGDRRKSPCIAIYNFLIIFSGPSEM